MTDFNYLYQNINLLTKFNNAQSRNLYNLCYKKSGGKILIYFTNTSMLI